MDFLEFFKTATTYTDQLTTDEKTECLHFLLKKVSPTSYAETLHFLQATVTDHPVADSNAPSVTTLTAQLNQMMQQGMSFERLINEEYDDWYAELDDEEFFYEDPNDHLTVIEDAIATINQLTLEKNYSPALELAETLQKLTFTLKYVEFNESKIIDFIELQNIFQYSLEKFYAQFFGLILNVTTGTNQMEKFLTLYLQLAEHQQFIYWTEIKQTFPIDLTDEEAFLTEFIQYLLKQTDQAAPTLLNDLLSHSTYFRTANHLADLALANYQLQPQLFINALSLETDANKGVQLGIKALTLILGNTKIRKEIAEQTKPFAQKLNLTEEIAKLNQEIFLETGDLLILLELLSSKTTVINRSLIMNKITDPATYSSIPMEFFMQQFDKCLQKLDSDTWYMQKTATIQSLFSLLLTDNLNTPAARRLFNTLNQHSYDIANPSQFSALFNSWKQTFSLSQEKQLHYLKWLANQFENYDLINPSQRSYYDELAAQLVIIEGCYKKLAPTDKNTTIVAKYLEKHKNKPRFKKAFQTLKN